jgi:hypothetical protein
MTGTTFPQRFCIEKFCETPPVPELCRVDEVMTTRYLGCQLGRRLCRCNRPGWPSGALLAEGAAAAARDAEQ